jgi:hypothetical protein
LTAVKGIEGSAEELSSVAQMIGTEVLTARLAALAASAGLEAAEEEVSRAAVELARAEAAAATREADHTALSVMVTGTGGPGHLIVTHYVGDAGWEPVYDMVLNRQGGRVAVERGVLVSQASGEDWRAVTLTLSTARPVEQAEPTPLWPEQRSVGDPYVADSEELAKGMADVGVMAEAAPVMAEMAYQGDTVIYHYPGVVDLASGVEDLRLGLDRLDFAVEVVAQAVPRFDQTAFVMATLVNDSEEILLPGEAYLYRDGALTGMVSLDTLAPGASAEFGFGAVDGIRLKRDMPQRAEGDRGVFQSSTQIEEKAVLEVENLTGEAWPVRLLDMVPYSEQEELEISYDADPAASEADVDGKRGILAWEFDLAAGEKKAVRLDLLMSWPEGKVLQ